MKITIPDNIKFILDKLIRAGYDAYVVGGCVRDSLRGEEPSDWDITTNALPEQIKQAFSLYPTINNNGEKHGTVTVRVKDENYEITTFRTETAYLDHRHPDKVGFTTKLEEDLSRRDFTINAMAADILGNVIDPFGGHTDLTGHIIRCVGNPKERFNEDALRILRGLRFAATQNAFIENRTLVAMVQQAHLLSSISKERVQAELVKMIQGVGFTRVLRSRARYVIPFILPEIGIMFDFEQRSIYHKHDLWEHSLSVVDGVDKNNYIVRIAALLHDIGKCTCYQDVVLENTSINIRHYKAHAEESYQVVSRMLSNLKFSKEDSDKILFLVRYHDFAFSEKNLSKSVKNLLQVLPEKYRDELFTDFLMLKAANQAEHLSTEKLISVRDIQQAYHEVLINNECFTLQQLAVSGFDVVDLGFKCKQIGNILADCLTNVIEGKLENNKEILLAYIKHTYKTID